MLGVPTPPALREGCLAIGREHWGSTARLRPPRKSGDRGDTGGMEGTQWGQVGHSTQEHPGPLERCGACAPCGMRLG